jgi:hypothetical protein
MHMPGDGRIDRIGDTDQRALDLLIGIPDRFEQGPMRGSLNAFFGNIAFHCGLILSAKTKKSVIAFEG